MSKDHATEMDASDDQAVDDQAVDDQAVDDQPVGGEPADDQPIGGEPVEDDPIAVAVPADLVARWQSNATLAAAPPRTGLRGRLTLRNLVAGALVVLLAFGLVWYYLQNRHHSQVLAAQAGAMAAARRDAALISNYDYRNLDQAFAAVEKVSTPAFAAKYKTSLGGALKNLLVQYKATSTGKVQGVGVVSASSSKAVVLVFMDQTVSNSANPGPPSTQRSRATVTLVHSGGRWLLSDLQLV